jgi:hypothetical protein
MGSPGRTGPGVLALPSPASRRPLSHRRERRYLLIVETIFDVSSTVTFVLITNFSFRFKSIQESAVAVYVQGCSWHGKTGRRNAANVRGRFFITSFISSLQSLAAHVTAARHIVTSPPPNPSGPRTRLSREGEEWETGAFDRAAKTLRLTAATCN